MPLHEIESSNVPSYTLEQESGFDRRVSRRGFLKIFGTTAAGVGAMSLIGCGGDDDTKSNIAEADSTPFDQPITNAAEHEFEIGEATIPLETLPEDRSELRLENSIPQKFLLQVGTDISVKGVILGEGAGNKVVLSVSDKNRVDKDGKPKTFVCILPDKITPEEVQAGSVSFEELMKMNGASYELTDGKAQLSIQETKQKGILPQLAKDQIDQEQKNAGVFFVPYNPLRPEQESLENPVVPVPEASLLSEGSTITQESDGRVVLKNTNGESTARARYYPWKKEWKWVKDPESVTDYTIREYADAKGKVFGIFDHEFRADPSRLKDPEFIALAEKLANQLVMGGIEIGTVFRGYTQADWRGVIDNWDRVQEAFSNKQLPSGFKYNWSQADGLANFAEQCGMSIRAQYLLWGKDMPVSITKGGFTKDEFRKILEFAVKSRVIKYKGRVKEWTVAGEVAVDLLSPTPDTRYPYDTLGETVVDDVAEWTDQIDPDADKVIVEDHVIEDTTDYFKQISSKFYKMLTRFRDQKVKINRVGIENNLFMYLFPTRAKIRSKLQEITGLGFGIASSEANIGSAPADGSYPALKTQNPVADPEALQAEKWGDLATEYIAAGADFALGGLTDQTGWTTIKRPEINPTIFKMEGKKIIPKKGFFAIRDAYKQAV